MGVMLDAREERIRAKAHDLWEADGKPEGRDRDHWEQAAELVQEEERRAAQAEADPEAAKRDGDPASTDDPIGVTLAAMKRQS
jgi:hypothetical protein